MKIKKVKSQGEYCYPATIAAAVKDANFQKSDGTAMTQGEINTQVKTTTDNLDSTKANKTEVVNTVEIDGDYLKVVKGTSTNNLTIPNSTKWDGVSQDGEDGTVLTMQNGEAVWAESSTPVTKDYIDLSLRDIQGTILSSRSTANCYVIKEAGDYKLPLIYGNAIKNGVVNSAAYTKASGATSNATDFVNAFNEIITQPYILNDTLVTSAQLSAADADGIFTDIIIKDGFLCFTVTSAPATGANGVISVKDPYDNIVWSWHIWIYPGTLYDYTFTTSSSTSYTILSRCLASVLDSNTYSDMCTTDAYWYYQFGRPIPFLRAADSNSTNITTNYGKLEQSIYGQRTSYISDSISRPNVLFINGGIYFWSYTEGCNLWDASATDYGQSEKNTVKTIYDPCPVGYKVGNSYIYNSMNINVLDLNGIYMDYISYHKYKSMYTYGGYYQSTITKKEKSEKYTDYYRYALIINSCQQASSGWSMLQVASTSFLEDLSSSVVDTELENHSATMAYAVIPVKE